MITDQELSRKFMSQSAAIGAKWRVETGDWLSRSRPDLIVAVGAAQEALDRAWTEVRKGLVHPIVFDMALLAWGKRSEEAIAAWEAR